MHVKASFQKIKQDMVADEPEFQINVFKSIQQVPHRGRISESVKTNLVVQQKFHKLKASLLERESVTDKVVHYSVYVSARELKIVFGH